MSLRRRLARLEAVCGRPGQPCPDPRPAVILGYAEGEPMPEVPADAPPCRHCGEVHALLLEEVVVERCRHCGELHSIRGGCGERGEATSADPEHEPADRPEATPWP